jgi:hypothetical protein
MAIKTKPAASTKTTKAGAAEAAVSEPGLPEGFVSPFSRVEMQPNIRLDDGLCCIAMLTNQPVDTIMKAALQHGLAPHGPAWVYASMLQSILRDYGLNAEEKECARIDALPDVALVTAHYNPATQYGRWVLWHHVRATDKTRSFHYCVDPAFWIEPSRQIVTTDFDGLFTPKSPLYYLQITPKTTAKARGK